MHAFSSPQSRGPPEAHSPSLQVSPTVQNSPSSHGPSAFTYEHSSSSSLHESVVHTFSSSQVESKTEQVPPPQVSFDVQTDMGDRLDYTQVTMTALGPSFEAEVPMTPSSWKSVVIRAHSLKDFTRGARSVSFPNLPIRDP